MRLAAATVVTIIYGYLFEVVRLYLISSTALSMTSNVCCSTTTTFWGRHLCHIWHVSSRSSSSSLWLMLLRTLGTLVARVIAVSTCRRCACVSAERNQGKCLLLAIRVSQQ